MPVDIPQEVVPAQIHLTKMLVDITHVIKGFLKVTKNSILSPSSPLPPLKNKKGKKKKMNTMSKG